MAKEMKEHNLTNFPALKELPGLTYETVKASKTEKDKDGKETKTDWEYQSPVFTVAQYDEIVKILGKENIIAIINDEAKVIYRNAPTPEKLMNDAVNALKRLGLDPDALKALLS